LIFALEGNW
jgi:hypothetical protein